MMVILQAAHIKNMKEEYKTQIGECYVIHPNNFGFKDNIVGILPCMRRFVIIS